MLKQILLGLLNYGPMTGYDLKNTIDASTAHFWHAHHSQIYTTLRDLEAEGLVTSEYVEEAGQPARRVYTLAEAGRAALRAWLDRPMMALPDIKESFMVRIFFSGGRDRAAVLAELRIQHELHRQKLAFYRAVTRREIEGHRQHELVTKDDLFFWQATLRLGEAYEAMYLAWLDETILALESV